MVGWQLCRGLGLSEVIETKEKCLMSAEFWVIIAVGTSGLAVGIAILALGWRAFDSLRRDIDALRGDMATGEE